MNTRDVSSSLAGLENYFRGPEENFTKDFYTSRLIGINELQYCRHTFVSGGSVEVRSYSIR